MNSGTPESRLKTATSGRSANDIVSVYSGDIKDCGGKTTAGRPGELVEMKVSEVNSLIDKGTKAKKAAADKAAKEQAAAEKAAADKAAKEQAAAEKAAAEAKAAEESESNETEKESE